MTNVSNRIPAFLAGKWTNCPIGISMYHYENNDITEYNIPCPFVEVITFRYAFHRGIAFAVDWRNSSSCTLWVSALHDDAWHEWINK